MHVLILPGAPYISRVWTSYECWLSMSSIARNGIVRGSGRRRRYSLVPMGSAEVSPAFQLALQELWATTSPDKANDILRNSDIVATNSSGKDQQLRVLSGLESGVTEEFNMLTTEGWDVARARQMDCAWEFLRNICKDSMFGNACGATHTVAWETGYPENELRETFADAELLNSCLPASVLNTMNVIAADLKGIGTDLSYLLAAGFTLRQLKEVGFKVNDFAESKVTFGQMLDVGFHPSALVDTGSGFDARRLQSEGFTANELKQSASQPATCSRRSIRSTTFSTLVSVHRRCITQASQQFSWHKGAGQQAS